ncbi:hypothetical protein HPB51_028317 [Rhipicephalus microplus]|uniref:Uncharacterized protein n=1 Tax=Rhipicephalus microplus TaxID=6941 RepID=A0A9J6CXA9_RHIMP|nr:hypothetical protein HPB51_028317 [Rhipicephalus microplus]
MIRPPRRCSRRHVSTARKPYVRVPRRSKASATGGGHSSRRPSEEDEVMNVSKQQDNPVFRGPEEDCDGPSTTPNANDECVTPKKARTDNQEDYSDARMIDSAEMNCDVEGEDRPFTTVTYEKAQPARITVIFKLTDPSASFWKVNPNKLASQVVSAAKKKVESFRFNRDGNFSDFKLDGHALAISDASVPPADWITLRGLLTPCSSRIVVPYPWTASTGGRATTSSNCKYRFVRKPTQSSYTLAEAPDKEPEPQRSSIFRNNNSPSQVQSYPPLGQPQQSNRATIQNLASVASPSQGSSSGPGPSRGPSHYPSHSQSPNHGPVLQATSTRLRRLSPPLLGRPSDCHCDHPCLVPTSLPGPKDPSIAQSVTDVDAGSLHSSRREKAADFSDLFTETIALVTDAQVFLLGNINLRGEQASDTITDINEWIASFQEPVQITTREVETTTDLPNTDSRLLHVGRTHRQRHNKKLRRCIKALAREIENHRLAFSKQQWGQLCDCLNGQISSKKTWPLLRHLLDPYAPKSSAQKQLHWLIHCYPGTDAKLLEELAHRYMNLAKPNAPLERFPPYSGKPNPRLDEDVMEAAIYEAILGIRTTSTPGPNGVINKSLRNLDVKSVPALMWYRREIGACSHECRRSGHISQQWRHARLVFIPKPRK